MIKQHILDILRIASRDELHEIQSWIATELNNRDPSVIAERKRIEDFEAARKLLETLTTVRSLKILTALERALKPGMRLKMNGCKDGLGLREFIKWDKGNIVCWQIRRTRKWNQTGRRENGIFTYVEEKTNQVTTHMANKVARVYIDEYPMTIKELLHEQEAV